MVSLFLVIVKSQMIRSKITKFFQICILLFISFNCLALSEVEDEDLLSDDLQSSSIFDYLPKDLPEVSNNLSPNFEHFSHKITEIGPQIEKMQITLHVLDKVIGRLRVFKISKNQEENINELSIKCLRCLSFTENKLLSEDQAFIEITETTKFRVNKLFSGWIFASYPEINLFTHPRYAIILVKCS